MSDEVVHNYKAVGKTVLVQPYTLSARIEFYSSASVGIETR